MAYRDTNVLRIKTFDCFCSPEQSGHWNSSKWIGQIDLLYDIDLEKNIFSLKQMLSLMS